MLSYVEPKEALNGYVFVMFDSYLGRWNLVADGSPIVTRNSRLLPVRQGAEPAMLKLATEDEERLGGALMEWWDGDGAARVLARHDDALLLERAEGTSNRAEMARAGRDDESCRVLCTAAERLHVTRGKPLLELTPLEYWFRDLEGAAAAQGGILVRSAETARALLAEPREVGVLHGDLHHGNVLDFGERGWLAINPKGLFGERGFDFANIFANPDADDPTHPVGTEPSRFRSRLEIVAEAAKLERRRLLCWILAWTGLSAVWCLDHGGSAAIALQVAELAAAELDR